MIKRGIRRALALAGFEIHRKHVYEHLNVDPVEFAQADRDVLEYVFDNRLTMASRQRVAATITACKYVAQADIQGDFVECGVWRGGNSIAAKLTFENYGSDKKVWLYDTFAGMTAPSSLDTTRFNERSTTERFSKAQRQEFNEWCFASLEDVQRNFALSGACVEGVQFVAGDVRKTLRDQRNLPLSVAVLRLDTDFHDSTKAELEAFYPRLSVGGSLLLDDFGHWDGARRAVQEYLEKLPPRARPLLQSTDYSGRTGVKTWAT